MSESSSEYSELTEMFRHLKNACRRIAGLSASARSHCRNAVFRSPTTSPADTAAGVNHIDDLVQAARLGLVNAVNRFDVDNGADLLSFAVPTMMGEVRRHFRDHGWAVKVPRRVKELQPQLIKARAELSQRLGRAPTASEIADHLGMDRDLVVEATIGGGNYSTMSTDAPVGPATTTDRSATPSVTLTPTWTRCSMSRRYGL